MSIRTIQTPYSTTSSAASTALYPRPMSRLPSSSPRRPYHHRALGKENAASPAPLHHHRAPAQGNRQFGTVTATLNAPAARAPAPAVIATKPVAAAAAAPSTSSSIDDPSAMDIARLVANILLRRYSGGRRATSPANARGGKGYVKSGLSAVLTVDV